MLDVCLWFVVRVAPVYIHQPDNTRLKQQQERDISDLTRLVLLELIDRTESYQEDNVLMQELKARLQRYSGIFHQSQYAKLYTCQTSEHYR